MKRFRIIIDRAQFYFRDSKQGTKQDKRVTDEIKMPKSLIGVIDDVHRFDWKIGKTMWQDKIPINSYSYNFIFNYFLHVYDCGVWERLTFVKIVFKKFL